jgi:hypothetical protein
MMHRLIALPLALALVGPALADTKSAAEAVAPFLDDQAVAVLRVNLANLDLGALADRLKEIGKLDEEQVAEFKKHEAKRLTALRDAGAGELYVVGRLEGFPHAGWAFVVVPLEADADASGIAKALAALHMPTRRIGNALVGGEEIFMRRLKQLKGTPHPELAPAFAAVKGSQLQAVFMLPSSLRRAIEETLPHLPPEVGGGPVKTATRGLAWAAVGANLTPKFSLKAVIQARDAETAGKLARLYDNILKALAKDKEIKRSFIDLQPFQEMLTAKVTNSRLTVSLTDRDLTDTLAPLLAKARRSAKLAQSTNNLKQMALAVINYTDAYKFPAHASYDKQGRPLLSWRVHILPFIEQQRLYQQFHLDEPWDSEHNKKLIAQMPSTYRSPGSKAGPGKTTYVVPVGKDTMFPPGPKGIRYPADVSDGTSNTLLIVEVDDAHAVTWTRPEDLSYDPKEPLRGLGGKASGRFLAAFADCSVRAISRTINLNDLRALFTRNGGEVIGNIP